MPKLAQVVKEEVSILEYAQTLGLTPNPVNSAGTEYTLKEQDSVRIDATQNLFFRHSTGQGGSIIDFVEMEQQVNTREALSILRGFIRGRRPYLEISMRPVERQSRPPVKKEFVLPRPAQGKFNRVFAYLGTTRGIDAGIVLELIHRNMLYEDESHNCIFVGYDKENNAAYGMRRGTLTDKGFKGEVKASTKDCSFFVDNHSPSLFVTESPIDSASIMTLLKINGRDHQKYSYLSLGGVSTRALAYRLPEGKFRRIYLALDNDAAGRQGKEGIREFLRKAGFKGEVVDKPPALKDFNDDLMHIRTFQKKPERAVQKNQNKERGLLL
jgi:hypothetical protein